MSRYLRQASGGRVIILRARKLLPGKLASFVVIFSRGIIVFFLLLLSAYIASGRECNYIDLSAIYT